jgi:hypothetical protein
VVTIPLAPRTAQGDRPGHRRARRRAGVPGPGRPAAGPAWRRADRPPDRPPRRDRQADHAAHAAARVHYRRSRAPECRCAMSRKPPRTRTRGPPSGTTGPAAAWTGTPPTSSPPTSQASPGKPSAAAPFPGGGNRQERHSQSDIGNDHAPLLQRERNRLMRGASVTGRSGWCHTELGVLGGYWPTRDGDRPGCSRGLTASRSGSVVCPTD